MNTKQWIQEFREELNELYIPALRLFVITRLYPYEVWPEYEIKTTFDTIQRDLANEEQVKLDTTLFENLYRILSLLPEPRAHNALMNERYELSEMQQSALNQLIDLGINLKQLSELPQTNIDKSLENFSNVCKHWKELLEPLQNNLEQLKQNRIDKRAISASDLSLLDDTFPLQGQDEYSEYSDECAINTAIDVARRLMKVKNIKPKKIIGLANAIYALQRLPQNTPGADIEYSLVIEGSSKYPDGSYTDETKYLSFHISDHLFLISRGGYIDRGAGYDSFSNPGWHFEIDGFREAECNLWEVEDEALNMLSFLNSKNPRTKIRVIDNSEIRYE